MVLLPYAASYVPLLHCCSLLQDALEWALYAQELLL
jgi:hypothetical protein